MSEQNNGTSPTANLPMCPILTAGIGGSQSVAEAITVQKRLEGSGLLSAPQIGPVQMALRITQCVGDKCGFWYDPFKMCGARALPELLNMVGGALVERLEKLEKTVETREK